MIKLYFSLLAFVITSLSFGQDLVISGVFDGPLPGGHPKGIELHVIKDIPDLSVYGLEKAPNGAMSIGSQAYTFPSDSYSKGDFIYIAVETPMFTQYMGFAPTYTGTSEVDHNGDDAILLYYNGALADVFGEVGTDGTGEFWDSVDGWAYRNANSGPNTSFTEEEWTFSSPNVLDGCDLGDDTGTNAGCASTIPVGTYATTLNSKSFNTNVFKIYPNPTSRGYVNITSQNTGITKVGVFDILGKQVISRTLLNSRLDVSELKASMYLMKITQNTTSVTKKLVIQ